MKTKILDFRLFLTVVLVVVCFFGDKYSTLNNKRTEVQNLLFINEKSLKKDKIMITPEGDNIITDCETQHYDLMKKLVLHISTQAVKEQP